MTDITTPPIPTTPPTGSTTAYRLVPFTARTWYGAKRYRWRVVARNGQVILTNAQAIDNREDRNETMRNFSRGTGLPIDRSEDDASADAAQG